MKNIFSLLGKVGDLGTDVRAVADVTLASDLRVISEVANAGQIILSDLYSQRDSAKQDTSPFYTIPGYGDCRRTPDQIEAAEKEVKRLTREIARVEGHVGSCREGIDSRLRG